MKSYVVTYSFQTKCTIAVSCLTPPTTRTSKKAVQAQFTAAESHQGNIATVPKHIHGLKNAANGKIKGAFQKLLLTVSMNCIT